MNNFKKHTKNIIHFNNIYSKQYYFINFLTEKNQAYNKWLNIFSRIVGYSSYNEYNINKNFTFPTKEEFKDKIIKVFKSELKLLDFNFDYYLEDDLIQYSNTLFLFLKNIKSSEVEDEILKNKNILNLELNDFLIKQDEAIIDYSITKFINFDKERKIELENYIDFLNLKLIKKNNLSEIYFFNYISSKDKNKIPFIIYELIINNLISGKENYKLIFNLNKDFNFYKFLILSNFLKNELNYKTEKDCDDVISCLDILSIQENILYNKNIKYDYEVLSTYANFKIYDDFNLLEFIKKDNIIENIFNIFDFKEFQNNLINSIDFAIEDLLSYSSNYLNPNEYKEKIKNDLTSQLSNYFFYKYKDKSIILLNNEKSKLNYFKKIFSFSNYFEEDFEYHYDKLIQYLLPKYTMSFFPFYIHETKKGISVIHEIEDQLFTDEMVFFFTALEKIIELIYEYIHNKKNINNFNDDFDKLIINTLNDKDIIENNITEKDKNLINELKIRSLQILNFKDNKYLNDNNIIYIDFNFDDEFYLYLLN